ncbi:hypothetical protein QR680_000367 [Steinernema hermaphroditum]|uniref:Uncharacterized protein n=1 Tax=Steinernema hermaphroditum TaxID=289476 RepID=A0AA39LDX5_9BILA|nr:hypothetical protein QR680_000367 [Steinernema hermaphroditum]
MDYVPRNFVDAVVNVVRKDSLYRMAQLSRYYGQSAKKAVDRRVSTVRAEFYISAQTPLEQNVYVSYLSPQDDSAWLQWTSDLHQTLIREVDDCYLDVWEPHYPDAGDSTAVDTLMIAMNARRVFLSFKEVADWKRAEPLARIRSRCW